MPDRGVQRYTCHTYLRRSEESTGIFPNPFVIHRPSRRRDCCTRLRRTTWGTIDSRDQNAHACRSRTLDLQNSSRMCTHHFRPNRPSTFRSPNKSLRKMVTQTPLQQCRSKHFAGTSNSGCPKIPRCTPCSCCDRPSHLRRHIVPSWHGTIPARCTDSQLHLGTQSTVLVRRRRNSRRRICRTRSPSIRHRTCRIPSCWNCQSRHHFRCTGLRPRQGIALPRHRY